MGDPATDDRGLKKASANALLKSARKKVKTISDIITSNIRIRVEEKPVCAVWYDGKNWGDALNPVLIRYLSGKIPIHITEYTKNPKNYPVYSVIGSMLDMPVLQNITILKNTVVWGTGFIKESGELRGVPRDICAVRGPLTRAIIRKQGMKCPEVYGDPALLYSRIYKPAVQKKYQLGIIPHYIDKSHECIRKLSLEPDVRIIDIEGPINRVVDEICSCRRIASSSLHGLIIADAYEVPSVWISVSDNVIGGGFKFRDYLGSVGRSETNPVKVNTDTTADSLSDEFSDYRIDINLNELLNVCPLLP